MQLCWVLSPPPTCYSECLVSKYSMQIEAGLKYGFQVNNKPLVNVASVIINFEVVFALDALPPRSPSPHSLTEAAWFAAAYMYICKPVLPIIQVFGVNIAIWVAVGSNMG